MTIRARKAHGLLAIFLGAFIAQHLAAHLTALGGIGNHRAALDAGRTVYRIPAVEMLLLTTFAAQIVLGLILARCLVRKNGRQGWWRRAQISSGLYLAAFILLHSGANLVARFGFDLDTGFFWPAGSLTLDPLPYLFAPYYGLALAAISTHLAAALHFRGKRRLALPVALSGPLLAVPILLVFSGALYAFELPQAYLDYYSYYGANVP